MDLGEKLIKLRRMRGYSQEQLADYLDVSRQSVSKWESGQDTPKLRKLIQISDLFQVTLDDLVREDREIPGGPSAGTGEAPGTLDGAGATGELRELRREVKEISASLGGKPGYEYKSRIMVGKLPLVHVHVGRLSGNTLGCRPLCVAKGIIAVGDVAVGVVSLGALSVGVCSAGAISVGVLSLGAVAAGGAAFGCVAAGVLAVGLSAVGVYSAGAAAVGARAAVGISAAGKVAVGIREAKGQFAILADGYSRADIQRYILEHLPGTWPALAKFLSWFVR